MSYAVVGWTPNMRSLPANMFFHFMYASLMYSCERELPLTRDAVAELPFSEAIMFPSSRNRAVNFSEMSLSYVK